jgi:hypothetical protein
VEKKIHTSRHGMKTRRRRKQSVVPVEDGQQEFEQGRTLAVSQSSSRRSSIHSLQKIHPHSGKLSRTNSNHNVYAEANGAHNQQTNPLLSNVKDGKISMIDWFSTEDEEPISDIMSAQQSAPLQPLLTELPIQKRWKDWWTRTLWTVIMITGFLGIISSGHIFVILMVVCIQTMVFKEVIAIAHVPSKEKKLPWFRLINW